MTYYAKSRLSNGRQPTVKEHLAAVKTLAKAYGSEISMEGEAELAGILHDFGKYSDRFKALLTGETHRINHAACGAALLATGFPKHTNLTPVIEAIFAHHDGLVSRGMIWESLKASILEEEPLDISGKEVALAGEKAYREAFRLLQSDFQEFPTMLKKLIDKTNSAPMMEQDLELRNLKDMLRSRMLLSCLVDADYCISALDENEKYLEESEKAPPSFNDTIAVLHQHVKSVRDSSHADTHLNLLRSQVFDACGAAALMPPGVFTLTAPTGTGKTLALLNFAVRHCEAWDTVNRIILVLPFLTLTEQSADTYKGIIPDLLVDTSQSALSDSARLFSSRWRVPVIITTSVKFFESLFSDRPSDCRKLHNIANSVILFDESQSLPPELTRATIRSVNELCKRYGCTMVFSTATQPDFSAIPTLENWSPKEILPDYADFYSELKRTEVEWRLDDNERTEWIPLAQELSAQKSVCAIVNLRDHARKLYRSLKERCREDEVFFLSTDLCPAHRRTMIDRIRERLNNTLPCRVVSTQCIEAGVDLDFDSVYRALAPLDSIIQAAGRCNRNGRLPDLGKVVVFRPDDERYPGDYGDHWYRNAAETVRRLCTEQPINIHDPQQIRRYFQVVFARAQDKPALQKAVRDKDYSAAAQAYRLIDTRGVQVIVPYSASLELFHRIRDEARRKGITPGLMRQAAPITVSCFVRDDLETFAERLLYSGKKELSDFYVIREEFESIYRDDMGLQFPDSSNVDRIF